MLYICEDCGYVFHEDRADVRTEKCSEEIWGSRQSWEESWLLCPDCGGENVREYWGDLEDGDNIVDEDEDEEGEDND